MLDDNTTFPPIPTPHAHHQPAPRQLLETNLCVTTIRGAIFSNVYPDKIAEIVHVISRVFQTSLASLCGDGSLTSGETDPGLSDKCLSTAHLSRRERSIFGNPWIALNGLSSAGYTTPPTHDSHGVTQTMEVFSEVFTRDQSKSHLRYKHSKNNSVCYTSRYILFTSMILQLIRGFKRQSDEGSVAAMCSSRSNKE